MPVDDVSEPSGSRSPSTWERPPRMRKRRRRAQRRLARAKHVQPINVAIVGVQKGATSSLFRMLAEHRGIAGGPDKETRWFFDPDRDWSDPDYSSYARAARRRSVRWALDATPAYIFWPTALERMQRYDPGMRLLLTVRDPIERAVSHWAMERSRDPEVADFGDAIERYRDEELPPLGQQDFDAPRMRRTSYFSRGLYGGQLERGLRLFPREQWHILEFRTMLAEPERAMDGVTDFLGLPAFKTYPELRHNMATGGDHTGAPATPEAVRRLVDRYADDLALFSELSGLDVSAWPTCRVLAGTMPVEELTGRINAKLGLASD